MFHELVEFWFSEEASRRWFDSTPEFDQLLRDRYQALWQQARDGNLDYWRDSPEGCLALVILLDQLPLNMFRGQAESFSTEAQSREVARHAIDCGFNQKLETRQRAFLYMPFMHSEDLADQDTALELFAEPGLESNLRFARHHRGIIEKFGRVPHRNAVLGRENSAAETEYMNSKEAFTG